MKRLLTCLAVGALAAGALAGCGGDSETEPTAGSPDAIVIALIAKANGSPYWTAVKNGALDAGRALGVTVTFNGPDTETEVDKQINLLQSAINSKPSGLGFAPLDAEASFDLMDQAKADGIPVIAFDTAVTGSDVPLTTIATDNVGAAEEAARHMIELTGGKGKVAILAHSQTASTGVQRRDGFQDYIKKNAPDIELLDPQYTDSDQAKSTDKAMAILQANPDLVGIFATDDDGVVGAAQEVEAQGKTGQVVVIGFDSGKAQMDLIRSSVISGSVTQNPYKIGYKTVELLLATVNGNPPTETFTDSGFLWYDKANIDSTEVQQAVYD
ncbi:MAG: ABC transporter substrate-binding protein [Propionibacteriaceae bacterium]|jgi:ribose transport system substrate-binding protein|nr:ABC transporter substrate-binding protein [Propionibacteriaceae bacterium]